MAEDRVTTRSWARRDIPEESFAALSAGMPASRLWSLLLDLFEGRAAQRTRGDLVAQWERDGFVRPCPIDQRTLVALDGHLLAAAAAFESIELSPLAPLGACSVVAPSSQNRIVSALRGTEVLADPTNVLALECARRLRADPGAVVRLATSHRCVRAQELPKQPGFAPHFRIFCLATAGRERGDHGFVTEALGEHITTMLAALNRLEQHGYAFPNRTVTVLASRERAHIGDRIAAALTGIAVERAALEHAYYDGLRYQIDSGASSGGKIPLIDGGTFDWAGRLASNRRVVFVASGMGSQLAASLCRVRD